MRNNPPLNKREILVLLKNNSLYVSIILFIASFIVPIFAARDNWQIIFCWMAEIVVLVFVFSIIFMINSAFKLFIKKVIREHEDD